jgi:signal transduction histidine kinase
MVQELLSNTLKHAKASTITIKLLFTENEVAVYYADNGIGFDYGKQEQEPGGIGVVSLQSRAELMKGHMKIRSLPGMGTQVEIKTPIQ